MFRRKGEDSLFDTNIDPNHIQENEESASVIASGPVTASAAAPSASASTAPISAPSASAPSQPISRPFPENRPVSEPRASAPQTANAFRPGAAPIGGDMSRNRMPEVKTAIPSPAMGLDKGSKSGRRVLTVGNDILLKGEIATCDRLVIEGKVDATLNDVHTVEISENGSFKGSANIEDAEISGLFEGDLVVRNCLVIRSTGKVRGKISYGEIEIERGGEMTGDIKTTNPQSTANRPVRPGAKETKDDKVAA